MNPPPDVLTVVAPQGFVILRNGKPVIDFHGEVVFMVKKIDRTVPPEPRDVTTGPSRWPLVVPKKPEFAVTLEARYLSNVIFHT